MFKAHLKRNVFIGPLQELGDEARQVCIGRVFQSKEAVTEKVLFQVHTSWASANVGPGERPPYPILKGLVVARDDQEAVDMLISVWQIETLQSLPILIPLWHTADEEQKYSPGWIFENIFK